MKNRTNKPASNPQKAKTDYRLGLFYFNRNDSRVLVPKRVSGMGWTLNFAHPYTYILIITIALIIVASNYFI